MSASDYIAIAALLLSGVSLLWQWRTQVTDRSGKIRVDVEPEDSLFFSSTSPNVTYAGTPMHNKIAKRLQISLTNIGREPRLIKSYEIQVLDGNKEKFINKLHNKMISMGETISKFFNQIDDIENGTKFKVVVYDTLGKKYESRTLLLDEFKIK